MNEILKKKFLESKSNKNHTSHDSNIHKISKNVYRFIQYNFLPGENPYGLDGHYCFAVNVTNFKYLVWKDSDYGGLTYVRDIENKVFLEIHESIKEEVESVIADKLLGAYFSEYRNEKRERKSLIADSDDYYKKSLICTWVDDYPNEPLGQLKEIEKMAIEKLES